MMKQFIKLYSIFLLLVSAQTVNAVTLTEPDPAQNNQIQSIESPVNISVVGSLYLDFSVFSVFDSFVPEGLVSLNADRVFIYPASRTPEIEDLSSISVFDSLPT